MTTLEARIAEVIAGHQLVGISLHEDAHCTGSGCGWTPTSSFLFPTADHRAHVAQMLAPVIREAQAEAWDECVHVYDSMVCLDCEPNAPTNPYRADNLEAS